MGPNFSGCATNHPSGRGHEDGTIEAGSLRHLISPIALEAVKRIDAQYFPSPYSTVPRSAVSIANTLRMSDWDKPNWRAISDGLTPALDAPRTALICPVGGGRSKWKLSP